MNFFFYKFTYVNLASCLTYVILDGFLIGTEIITLEYHYWESVDAPFAGIPRTSLPFSRLFHENSRKYLLFIQRGKFRPVSQIIGFGSPTYPNGYTE